MSITGYRGFMLRPTGMLLVLWLPCLFVSASADPRVLEEPVPYEKFPDEMAAPIPDKEVGVFWSARDRADEDAATAEPTGKSGVQPTDEPAPEPREEPFEELRSEEKSDLVALSLTLSPQYPVPGQPVDLVAQVYNRAEHDEEGIVVAVYVDDTLLDTHEVDIAARTVISIPATWHTVDRSGKHTVAAVVDPAFSRTERERSDNLLEVETVVSEPPPTAADFAVTEVDTVRAEGAPGMVRAVIHNNGSTSGRASFVLYADGEATATRLVGPIPAGEEETVEIPWPTYRSVGDLEVAVNGAYQASEPNANDNSLGRTGPTVNLRIEDLSVSAMPLEPNRPRQITISLRVVNDGSEDVTSAFRTEIEPGIPDVDGERPFIVETERLASGASTYIAHTIPTAGNDFDIRVETDIDGAVSEYDKTDNAATSHFKNPAPDIGRWVSIGPRRITLGLGAVGRLGPVIIDPTDPETIYVGARGSGVWKTLDGGLSWRPIADSLPTVRIADLDLAPNNPSVLYATTFDKGIFRSGDGGQSWSQVTNADLNVTGADGRGLLLHAGNPDIMHLTTRDGLRYSDDGGENWQVVLPGQGIPALVADPSDPDHILASLNGDANTTGIYVTFNGGTERDDWRKLTGCPGGRLPAVTADTSIKLAYTQDTIYASFKEPDSWTLYRTTDTACSIGGRLEVLWETGWQPTGSTGGEPTHRRLWSAIYADPSDPRHVYAAGTDLWRSTNFGDSFSRITEPHVDHHGFAFHPDDPRIIYTGSDGGLYRSDDRGKSGTWEFRSDGAPITEFYDIADGHSTPGLVIGGTQDNGASRYDGESTVWRYMTGGDSEAVEIHPTDDELMYELGQSMNQTHRSTNGGDGFGNIGNGLPDDCPVSNEFGPDSNHFLLHPASPDTLLATCGELWRGLPWEAIFDPRQGSAVRLAVDGPIDLYYVGTNQGALYAGPGGDNWEEVFSHPNDRSFTDLEIDPNNSRAVYATFQGSRDNRVYRLVRDNSQPASMSDVDITSDLPRGLSINAVAVDRLNEWTVYVSTSEGVYRGRSSDQGATWWWRPYNNGMPSAVVVTDLEVHPVTGVMRAGTFGRSAYEIHTAPILGSILAAEGKVTLLRVHDVGTGYGPDSDHLDVEVVIKLDSKPGRAFGFRLRDDANESSHRKMLDVLRGAFNHDQRVHIVYERTGLRNGRIFRLWTVP